MWTGAEYPELAPWMNSVIVPDVNTRRAAQASNVGAIVDDHLRLVRGFDDRSRVILKSIRRLVFTSTASTW